MLSFDTLLNLIEPRMVADALLEQHPASCGMNFHSGRLEQGEIFFALAGAQQHGLRFAEQALAKGASFLISDQAHPRGIVVDDPVATILRLGRYARQQLRNAGIPVIAVTGSVGKTSSKAMLATALEAASSLGNFNTPLALACTLLRHALRQASCGHAQPLVLELGIDHVGEMQQLCALVQPDIAMLTSIAPSHLSGLGDIATVAREKTVLIDHASQAFVSEQAAAYLTAEQQAKSIMYGLGEACQVQGRILETKPRGQRINVLNASFNLPYIGKAMATNATGALAVARALRIPLSQAAKHLEEVQLEPQRLQVHQVDNIYLIDDAYNSNPASVREALDSLQHFPRPHTLIVGDMLELGTDSEVYHRQLGQWSKQADAVIAIGEASRVIPDENPQALHAPDAEAAIAFLSKIEKGTVLVKASRGLKLERIVQHLQQQLWQSQPESQADAMPYAPNASPLDSFESVESFESVAASLLKKVDNRPTRLEGQVAPC